MRSWSPRSTDTARLDCEGFRKHCIQRGLDGILLYVGGNLVVGKTPREAVVKKFEALGFDGVFTAADDWSRPPPACGPTWRNELDDARQTNRKRRIPQAPPGGVADLAHRGGGRSPGGDRLPAGDCAAKQFAQAMREAAAPADCSCSRAGVALLAEHVKLLKYLETEGGADLLPTTIDAYTRQNRYQDAAKGIEKSLATGMSLLNGFPAVNYGVKNCRLVTEALGRPVQVRHGTPDARLLAEIALAGGFTSFEGGGISYNIPYAKNVPLRKSLTDWQYVDRLCGLYEEQGVAVNREPFGPLTGTLVPPCIGHAVAIVEGLLALEQGVKSVTLGYGQAGNLIQDVAAIKSLKSLADRYFRDAGFSDFELTTVFHQWMGGFPEDEAKAFAVIGWGTVVACLAGADKLIVKTPHEADGRSHQGSQRPGVEGHQADRQHVGRSAAVGRPGRRVRSRHHRARSALHSRSGPGAGQGRGQGRGHRRLRQRRLGRRLRPRELLPGKGRCPCAITKATSASSAAAPFPWTPT